GDGTTIDARLLVACDGLKSKIRDMAGIRTVHKDYGQSGIVCTVKHERPHGGRAEEHFLPSGPFAILPLKGDRSSLVWTEPTREAERLVASDDMMFDIELEQRFGHKLGRISVEGGKRAFPLGLTLARDFVKPRIALAGDAAHGIHPIAGQGLNLGFKDAAALAEVVVEAARLGLDIGALDTLETYQRWRRFDTVQMGVTTDILNRLFSNDNPLLRAARSFGLSLVDRTPPLKDFFISQAAGTTRGPSPRLLQGEPI
ncbi:MAG: FAD-dependent monooxygenase, partial [Rhizobiaceae bacterium]|nr:FAD-dependent monooxygenase [Rhizobiaceae bacterium]